MGNKKDLEEKRQMLEAQRRKEAEAKARQNKLFWLISAVIAVVVLIAVLVVVLIVVSKPAGGDDDKTGTTSSTETEAWEKFVETSEDEIVQEASLDFSDIDLSKFVETVQFTDYIRFRVSYTNQAGAAKTGDIVVRLFPDVAPITCANMQNLVKKGVFNGSSFHRVVNSFMIQGGIPATDDRLTPILGEFTQNGWQNNLTLKRGAIAMARTSEPDSATSSFFIMHQNTYLSSVNGAYAGFGWVVSGMDVVDEIAEVKVAANPMMNNEVSSPVYPITIESAVFLTDHPIEEK